MAVGLTEQIERKVTLSLFADSSKPWKIIKNSHRCTKTMQHRKERREARLNPECIPKYRKYYGYEW